MYQYDKNYIEINGNRFNFEHDIRTVIPYGETYVVLLGIPFSEDTINNLYCLDDGANLVWQSEDLDTLYPNLRNLAYEQMGIKDDIIYASDFWGRCYHIDPHTGKIEGCHIVK